WSTLSNPPLSAPAVQAVGDVSARPPRPRPRTPSAFQKLLYDRSTDVVKLSTAPASNARVLDPDSFVLNEILMATIGGLKISYVPFPLIALY
ncbi:hypothetical protein EVAR_95043_1, partial [Eumeta japonica]